MNRFFSSFCQSFGTMLLILVVSLSAISAYADDPGDPGGGQQKVCAGHTLCSDACINAVLGCSGGCKNNQNCADCKCWKPDGITCKCELNP
jgi:hypothetical protein